MPFIVQEEADSEDDSVSVSSHTEGHYQMPFELVREGMYRVNTNLPRAKTLARMTTFLKNHEGYIEMFYRSRNREKHTRKVDKVKRRNRQFQKRSALFL